MNDYTGLIETTWFLISLIGLLLSLYSIFDTISDMRSLDRPTNGRWILGLAILITEILRGTMQGAWSLVGLWLITEPGNTINPSPIVLILIGGNVIIMLNTIVVLIARQLVRERPVKDGKRKTDI